MEYQQHRCRLTHHREQARSYRGDVRYLGALRFSVGVSSKKFHGLSSTCTHSVGMIGHSSARAMWVVPVVSHTTSSVFSMEWLSWVNCPRPESLS